MLAKKCLILLWIPIVLLFYTCEKSDTKKDKGVESFSFSEVQVIGPIDTTNLAESPEFAFLIAIGGISVSNTNGNIYVLDANHKKVFAFDSSGSFINTIGNGHGRGPGEFELANSMTIDLNDRIFVYDYSLRRISVFEPTGELIATIGVKVPSKSILRTDGDIWISYLSGKAYQVASLSMTGDSLNYFLPTDKRDLEFSPYGMVAKLGKTKENEILVASTVTGVWYENQGQTFKKFGIDLFENEEALEGLGGVFVSPGSTMAIGELSENKIAIAFKDVNLDKDGRPLPSPIQVAIFERNGKLLNILTAPAETDISQLVYFDNNDNIYFDFQTDSTPIVKKFRIEKSDKAL